MKHDKNIQTSLHNKNTTNQETLQMQSGLRIMLSTILTTIKYSLTIKMKMKLNPTLTTIFVFNDCQKRTKGKFFVSDSLVRMNRNLTAEPVLRV